MVPKPSEYPSAGAFKQLGQADGAAGAADIFHDDGLLQVVAIA
jgi:hypothetical protein